ncbi:MAG: argininosuccinate lyase [Chloroflexi bacterium]|nr:MAG: argininosuccinate lyase [Chloroflexota bacterium]
MPHDVREDTRVGDKPLWSGRFSGSLDPKIREFTSSLELDKRIATHDVRGSIAHARMLGKQKIISEDESARIVRALEQIASEIAAGTFAWPADAEDVHSAIERVLTERIGPLGGKLHTARSRNDQIALDLRLFVIELLGDLDRAVKDLALALVERAGDEVDTVMPGYTHLQRAQPVSLAHHLLAHVEALRRDRARIEEAHERAAVSPLGAGALAGVPYPIDVQAVARELKLPRLVRGRAARIIGDLVAVLTSLKGLPLAYDGDLQEQRIPLYDAASVAPALSTLAHVVRGLRFDRDAMRRATERGMLTATDLADHLARNGVPFREAHEIVGRLVRERLDAGKDLAGLTTDDLRKVDPRFGPSAVEEIDPARSLASRRSPGGTAPENVRAALEDARRVLRG